MKKQIAKSISTLSLLLVLSVGAVNVSAFPWCNRPSCRTTQNIRATPAQTAKPDPAQDASDQGTVSTAQADVSFRFAFFLAQLAMSFPYLP
jgi:hypothetical protein